MREIKSNFMTTYVLPTSAGPLLSTSIALMKAHVVLEKASEEKTTHSLYELLSSTGAPASIRYHAFAHIRHTLFGSYEAAALSDWEKASTPKAMLGMLAKASDLALANARALTVAPAADAV